MATVTDANKTTACFAYDGLDRLYRWHLPSNYGDSALIRHRASPELRLSFADPDCPTFTYDYDGLDRVKEIKQGSTSLACWFSCTSRTLQMALSLLV